MDTKENQYIAEKTVSQYKSSFFRRFYQKYGTNPTDSDFHKFITNQKDMTFDDWCKKELLEKLHE